MKKLIILILLAVAGYFVYTKFVAPTFHLGSGPRSIFIKFADAWAEENNGLAMHYAEGDEVENKLKNNIFTNVIGITLQTNHGTKYTIESETIDGDNATVKAVQKVYFDPSGVESAMRAAMVATIHHEAELKKTSDGWKVTSFELELLDVGDAPKPN